MNKKKLDTRYINLVSNFFSPQCKKYFLILNENKFSNTDLQNFLWTRKGHTPQIPLTEFDLDWAADEVFYATIRDFFGTIEGDSIETYAAYFLTLEYYYRNNIKDPSASLFEETTQSSLRYLKTVLPPLQN